MATTWRRRQDQRPQRLGCLVGEWTRGGAHGLPEVGQRLRVQSIGRSLAPRGLGKVTHLSGIDYRHWELGHPQLRHQQGLIASGRLKHDHLGGERLQPFYRFGDSRPSIGQAPLVAAGTNRHVPCRFGHIDPDDHAFRLVHLPSLVPSWVTTRQPGLAGYGLSKQLAPATVRAHRGEGRDDPC
jgi:hypothetical protein